MIDPNQNNPIIAELYRMSELQRERAEVYGDAYLKYGPVMRALFPDGLTLKSDYDFVRMGIITQCVNKLMRYCEQFESGGHLDSARDLGVYGAMLASVMVENQS